jgi:Zn-dependent protease with chaperone function
VSVATTFMIMILEIVSYSAVLSPSIILNAKREESFYSQLLVGHSIIQGNYLLVVRAQNIVRGNSEKHASPLAQFNLGDSTYTLHSITLPEVALKEDLLRNSHIEVVTRRGIIASFNSEVELADVRKNILFNRYYLEEKTKSTGFTIELRSEYSLRFVLAILIFTVIFPGMLYMLFGITKIFNRKISSPIVGWIVLACLFLLFIFSVAIPAALNYCYTMGPILLYTDSHLLAMVLSILVPVFLSVLIVIKVADHFAPGTNHSEQHLNDNNSHEGSFLSERDKRALLVVAISLFSYVYVFNFTLPLNLQAKILHDLSWFIVYFLCLVVIMSICWNYVEYYMGNYTEINNRQLLESIKYLESKTGNKIRLFLKQHSKEEINAWVLILESLFSRQIRIYLTEGIINAFNYKEIATILAHEIGHIKLNHHKAALLLALLTVFSMGIVVFLSRVFMLSFGWWQFVVTMLIYVFVSMMIIRWLPNIVSKKLEHKADEYTVKLLSDKELYVNTLIKMHELKYSDYAFTSRREWEETHPSLQKRIDHLDKMFPPGENYG